MKKIQFIAVFSCISFFIHSQTSIPGGTVNGLWTLSGSPYNVNGSIMIPNNDSLRIQAGVQVNFQGAYKLLVSGKLRAVGTAADTIVFTASNPGIGWRGIRFDNTGAGNDTSRIQYCKITYGNANGSSPDDKGGAIYFYNFSKVKVSDCLVASCSATTSGGAIYCENASPLIGTSVIKNNLSNSGGAVYLNGSNAQVYGNIISGNTSANYGGGIYCANGGSPAILSNQILNNTSGEGAGIYTTFSYPIISTNAINNNSVTGLGIGGGIRGASGAMSISSNTILGNRAGEGAGLMSASNSTISNNVISGNTAINGGGQGMGGGGLELFLLSGTMTINNNFITNNSSASGGGGVYFLSGSFQLNNNVICNNQAIWGGAFYSAGVSSDITNNTISNNLGSTAGGGFFFTSSSQSVLRNCILWNNSSPDGNEVYLSDDGSDPNIYYSDIKNGSAGFGLNGNFYTGTYSNNINADPDFVLASGGAGTGFSGLSANWELLTGSPCINTGDPAGSYPATDIAGNPRVINSVIDLGAYEWPDTSPTSISVNSPKASILIFPNPSSGKFRIEGLSQEDRIEVYNIYQQIMWKDSGANTFIDVSHLDKGVYLLRILQDKKTFTRKLIIE